MKAIGYITVTLLTLVLGILWGGYVLSVLWGWFLVPLFGIKALTTGQAIAFCVVTGYLLHRSNDDHDDKETPFEDTLIKAAKIGLLRPLMFLLMGWIVRACVTL